MEVTTTLNASQKYAAALNATQPSEESGGSIFTRAAADFATTLARSEEAAKNAMTTSTVDPHTLVEALAQTELAVETAVTVRNKVVEAYQEILRMPV